MKTIKRGLVAMVAIGALSATGSAIAGPTFSAGFNRIFYNNSENTYRTDANCAAFGDCLGASTGPAGWQLISSSTPNPNQIGDVFAGIFLVNQINDSGGPIWPAGDTDQFSGYFAQEITAINRDFDGLTDRFTFQNPTADPFGVLGANEMFRIYVDPAATYTVDGGGLLAGGCFGSGFCTAAQQALFFANVNAAAVNDVTNATDGTLWASFGVGGAGNADGFGYSEVIEENFATTGVGEAFFALNNVLLGPAYNAGNLFPLNDVAESTFGGQAHLVNGHTTFNADIIPCPAGAIDPFGVAVVCTDYAGQAEFTGFNQSAELFVGGNSPWTFDSNDPLEINIPEPGTLTLMGLGLLAAGAARRRRALES